MPRVNPYSYYLLPYIGMNKLLTDNPIALQALLSETIFTAGGSMDTVADTASVDISNRDGTIVAVDTQQANKVSLQQSFSDTTAVKEEFVYQGDKSKGVLFILRYPQYPYFSPAAEDAFVKTMAALHLTPQDVAVVNLANPHNPNDFKRIMSFFQPKKITLLGVEPASLKLPAIEHNSYMRGRIATVFNTFSFEEMFDDVNKKKLFWGEFKMFLSS